MRKFALGLFALVSFSFSAGSVKAQTYDWSGIYFGGHAGYSWANAEYNFTNINGAERFSHDPSGFIGGAQAGFQRQSGRGVIGLEASWSGLDLSDAQTSVLQPGRIRRTEFDNLVTVVGRVGWAHDTWLTYIKGGYAGVDVDTFAINPVTGVRGSTSGWEHGWTIGAGIEKALTDRIIVGVEYNFARFIVSDRVGTATDSTGFAYDSYNADIHSVMARLSYKFGHERERVVPLK